MQRRHALATLPVLPWAIKAPAAEVPALSATTPIEDVLYLGEFTFLEAPLLAPGMVMAMHISGALHQDEKVRFTFKHGSTSLAEYFFGVLPCLKETVTGRVHLGEDGPRLLVTQVDEEIVVR